MMKKKLALLLKVKPALFMGHHSSLMGIPWIASAPLLFCNDGDGAFRAVVI